VCEHGWYLETRRQRNVWPRTIWLKFFGYGRIPNPCTREELQKLSLCSKIFNYLASTTIAYVYTTDLNLEIL
jgi:hypothetical protein